MTKLENITQDEIEKMVNDGRNIYWHHEGYKVIKDNLGQFLIKFKSGNCVGLKSEFVYSNTSDDFVEI